MFKTLANEDGNRILSSDEQFRYFPSVKQLRPYDDRPLWLVLSIAIRELGYQFRNGLGINGQMENIRKALELN